MFSSIVNVQYEQVDEPLDAAGGGGGGGGVYGKYSFLKYIHF